MRTTHRAPLLASGLIALLGVSAMTPGCDDGPSSTVERTLTSTVTLGQQQLLIVDSVVQVAVVGERRTDEVLVRLDATMTASSAELAERLLDAYALESDLDGTPGAAIIRIPPAEEGLIGGELVVRAPLDLDLQLLSRSGLAEVEAMRGALDVQSANNVRVLNAESDVLIRVSTGSVLLDTNLRPGNRIDIATGQGDVQVDLPIPLDAAVSAASSGGVVSRHPELPSRPAGLPYELVAGQGFSSVVVTTQRGTIVFGNRGSN